MSSTPSRLKREGGISIETLQQKRASSRVEGRISCFFSKCGAKLGLPLKLRRGPQGPTCIASKKSSLFSSCEGHIGIPRESLMVNRPCLEFSRETQCTSPAVTGISGFLSRFNDGVRPRLVSRHGTLHSSRVVQGFSGLRSSSIREFGLFLEDQRGRQASHPVVRGYFWFHRSRCRGIRTYLELRGHLVSFFFEAGSAGFHSRFNM